MTYSEPARTRRRIRTTSQSPAVLAAVALISLLGAGCDANAPAGNGTASSAGTGTSAGAADRGMAVKFAECMRNSGIRDFPDPDAKGEFAYGVSVTPAVFQKAVDACKDLEPPGALSATRNPEEQTAALRFAQCMRDNGVKDFPDPVEGEPLINTYRIPSTDRPGGMTILNAAIPRCKKALDQAAAGQ